ncbi:MAG: hypothetical protein AABW75_04390 [Nanoarchaeota archaeon]
MQTLETTVNEEIAEELRKYKTSSITVKYNHVLNNFHMHFPSNEEDAFYRTVQKILRRWNKPFEETGANNNKISDLKRNQTREQFYQTIDDTTAELGISLDKIKSDVSQFYERKEEELQPYQNLWNTLFPIYARLREKGYSKWDLIG